MKKYIYGLFFALVSVAMFTACSEDEGSDIGSDSQAKATLYQYTATEPNDADIDTQIRIATNSATQSAYLLVEKTADYESRLTQLGEEGYKDYVLDSRPDRLILRDQPFQILQTMQCLRHNTLNLLHLVTQGLEFQCRADTVHSGKRVSEDIERLNALRLDSLPHHK